MIVITKEDIKNNFTMKEAISSCKEAFKYVALGAGENPLRSRIDVAKEEGTILMMPAYLENIDFASLKVVSVFPHNKEKKLDVTSAQVLLIDGETGIIEAVLDGTYITRLRTGAATGVAFDYLGKKEAKIGAIIGAGGQAYEQLEAMIEGRNLKEIRIASKGFESAKRLAKLAQEKYESKDIVFVPVKTGGEAVRDADLIATVTTSKKPLFDGKNLKKGATLSLVGAYTESMREIDDETINKASKIFCDSVEASLEESGDLIQPLKSGVLKRDKIKGDMGDVILGKIKGRENDDEIIIFETVGIGMQDLITSKDIYKKLQEHQK